MSNPHPVELIARGVAIDRKEPANPAFLLCRNVKKGYFYLPGGHIDPGESAAQALQREFLEETGQKVLVGPCLVVAEVGFGPPKDRRQEINVMFHVEHFDGAGWGPIASREPSIDFAWMNAGEISDADIRPACLKRWLVNAASRDGRSDGADPDGFSKILWASDFE